ncbi:SET domain containing protein [Dorcoceras hygrometricum]|uniref:SET domain containing protein n=1 Tax=Dorcoceras hygrometricum TaxID=472368 RepID=A0A2Z7AJB4_9LAMI|nr:SET domain containing protein [Dorcoceras hygrometricum]
MPVLEAVIGYSRNAKLLPFECCVDLVELRSGFRLLPESSGFLAGLVVAQYKDCVCYLCICCVAYGYMLASPHVACTHGNPSSTAGRGFNPAGGAPGGG